MDDGRAITKAAGGVLTAKQAPAGPALPRGTVCAWEVRRHLIGGQPAKA